MTEAYGGQLVANVMKEEGIKHIFGVHGGHIWPLLTPINEAGIKTIHMRHEQSGVFAADAYSKASGEIGVCFGTAGPGVQNMAAGISQSYLGLSPILALMGGHYMPEDHRGGFQEGYGIEMFKPILKWGHRVIHWKTIPYYVRKAFKECHTYPPGPVGLELPGNILVTKGNIDEQVGFVPRELDPPLRKTQADPAAVEKAVRMLLEAETPIVVAGDGLYWPDGSGELKEFVELIQAGVNTRRMARGAVPQDHYLSINTGSLVRKFADVILVIGVRFNSLEGFGLPYAWPQQAKYILLNEAESEMTTSLPVQLAMVGNAKLVLQQMIDCAKSMIKDQPQRPEFLAALQAARDASARKNREEAENVSGNKPIHPYHLSQEITDFLDDSATIIYDSFTGSNYLTSYITSRFAGKTLDASNQGGVGHGIGMGIGAQVARPGKQVLVMMGDGGFGVSGMDIETAVRHKLPVVYVVYNNSSWMSCIQPLFMGNTTDNWDMMSELRYDKMFESIGVHGELVVEPTQIKPALERAFNSGKTAIVNIMMDKMVVHPQHVVLGTFISLYQDWDKIPEEGRKMLSPDMREFLLSVAQIF